ncbi:atypical/PIKK/PI4K protein kinase [Peniophora sp. CONT]|nr:atypical/PIKK/PI4K protein kinase [Peniophora sp. CONT]
MDFLEFNVHQMVLTDLAASVGASREDNADETVQAAVDAVTSGVVTRAETDTTEKVLMPASRVRANIGFAELSVNMNKNLVSSAIPVLLDILRDIPFIECANNLSWDDWALPDQLVYSTVSALLRLAGIQPESRSQISSAVLGFVSTIVDKFKTGTPIEILSHHALYFHGFYRAIISTHYAWQLDHWLALSRDLNSLLAPDVLERLNGLLMNVISTTDADEVETLRYVQTLLSRYISRSRPLNGYFLVCCVIETQWTVLAQTLYPHNPPGCPTPTSGEAAAANAAWTALTLQAPIQTGSLSHNAKLALRETISISMQVFTDLLLLLEQLEQEPSYDTYAWETLSESLKLAAVCTVALRELDQSLFSRLKGVLSVESPISDSLVQVTALKTVTVLVQHFPDIAPQMVVHLRRFVSSPLPALDYDYVAETRAPATLHAAAKCLALCIKLAPGEDLIMSTMYSLLNHIAATSKEINELNNGPRASILTAADSSTTNSGENSWTEEEKRLIGISTISVVSRLALEFDREEVTKLTIAMLVQRLSSVDPTAEATISHSLVDLALKAPEQSFRDIVRAFSLLSRSTNTEDPRFSHNMVVAAQTRLAQELHQRPELYDVYLTELLTLFSDQGVAIQNALTQDKALKPETMVEQLVSLLLPIDALLAHADYTPRTQASPELVVLFRNMWFLCTLFQLGAQEEKEASATEWRRPALARIAVATPPLISEDAHDTFVSDVEFNPSIRLDYANSAIVKHRNILNRLLPTHHHQIRSLSSGLVIFLLAMHDVESMRSAAGYPASLISYFTNSGLDKAPSLDACMEAMAEKVMKDAALELNLQAREQALPAHLSVDLQALLIGSTHRVARARAVAASYLNRLITSFPSLMCDPPLVFAMLKTLTLLRRACEGEFIDEYNPEWEYRSERADIVLQLTDDYKIRDEILTNLKRSATMWLELALARAPVELQTTLQKYLAVNQSMSPVDTVDLGASIAEQFGKAIGPVEKKLAAFAHLSKQRPDRAKLFTSQLASKAYSVGEMSGLRLADRGAEDMEKSIDDRVPVAEMEDLKKRMAEALHAIREKRNAFSIQDLKRMLFRCASSLITVAKCDYAFIHHLVALPFEAFTPSSISAGIEVWTWVISERPEFEISVMAELSTAWALSIKHERGIFSKTQNYEDPNLQPVQYTPTDKDLIDRNMGHARRLLSPHTLILQMLFSRLQAARYRRPGLMLLILRLVLQSAKSFKTMSTHPLAREARFSFLLFGFEALKSSRLDSMCEHILRESLYATAFGWFADRPQWSFGTNRLQLDADTKLLSEFLAFIKSDAARLAYHVTSLAPNQVPATHHYYINRVSALSVPLQLLVENEMYRLSIWDNPVNDLRRGTDYVPHTERSMVEASWTAVVRTLWEIEPTIAVHMAERFKQPPVSNEVGKLVRSNPRSVLHSPEALRFLVGETLDPSVRRDLKYLLVWDPAPPVTAISFYEPRYKNDPIILQYAHRVLAQHPVDLTFFFVPQVVQALRHDDLGYVAHFIFEQAKVSQLFCHQIIWNMKANTYKDDNAELADPMKPQLDKVTDEIVAELSGEAREFYDREFSFFNEVTSISGKLKPYIKKTKPEKKAKIDEEMAKIQVDVGVYLPSNPDGVVIDIDKKSGRPLQSHAKAPFMATFKVRKETLVINSDPDSILTGDDGGEEHRQTKDVWLQAIFKVGDDCRQDVLALQVIAMFKNVFESVGLTLYLYPYRVTATAPGCGVIDVVPNATSRDEMGRAKVNDLHDFFVARYGSPNTVAFQHARLNFISSMAAYSLACYILQIKDRHNGNIMIDAEGHIVHIDFGFLFDIGPGGVKFEPSSFKLNHEMIVLMGGRGSQGYALFQQMCVKGFLALRPHTDQLVGAVQLMLGTGLPSFKGEGTIQRLRSRFAPGIGERQAAEFMMGIVKNAHENVRSTVYDEFQRLQNGIPYK